MINKNELRIGNYVELVGNIGLGYKKVVVGFYKLKSGQEIDKQDCDPIPLTAEILEKCGFKKHEYEYYLYSKGTFEGKLSDTDQFQLTINLGEHAIGKPLKHLHQLQNLYFALTGEELEIKQL